MQDSSTSSGKQDDSSAGASRTPSTGPWGLVKFLRVPETYGSTSSHVWWEAPVPGAQATCGFVFSFDETTYEPLVLQALFARLLCHILVNRIPDRGLMESCESLRDLYEAYSRPVRSALPAQTPRTVIAKRGSVYPRPNFHVEDEE